MKGLKREIQLKAGSIVQASSWKAIIQQQIEKSQGKKNDKAMHIKKWWKMVEVDYKIFLKTANTGDLLIYHMDERMVEPEDHPDDLYHYALIVKHLYKQRDFKIFFYDCVLCQYKLCSFQEFYREILEKGFNKLMYRKVCALRDEEYFERQKEFFECDPEIQINTMKRESPSLIKRMQAHAYMEGTKCY